MRVDAPDVRRHLGATGFLEREPHRASDLIAPVGRQNAGALALNLDYPAVSQLGFELVVEVERQTEGVESRAEVGRGSGYGDAGSHAARVPRRG